MTTHKSLAMSAVATLSLFAVGCAAEAQGSEWSAAEEEVASAQQDLVGGPTPAVTVEIVGRGSGLCLDITGVSYGDFAPVQQWGCGGGSNQAFRLMPVGDGSYTIEAVHSGKCLDVNGWSTSNFATVQQYACTGATNQRFTFKKLSGGDYQIKAVHSQKCLNVVNFATNNGARIQQYDCNEDSNERFILRRKAAQTGLALVVLLQNGGYFGGLPANPSVKLPSFSCANNVVNNVTSAEQAADQFLRDRNVFGAADWYLQRMLGGDYSCAYPSNWSQQTVPAKEFAAPYLNTAVNSATRATVSAAVAGAYDTVSFLEDQSMTPAILRSVLEWLAVDYRVDVHVLTHGSKTGFGAGSVWFGLEEIRGLGNIPGLDLRAVYQMNCYGSSLRDAWTFAGADVVSGSYKINYAPWTYFDFLARFQGGQAFSTAVQGSYDAAVPVLTSLYSRIDLYDERADGDYERNPAQFDPTGTLASHDEVSGTAPQFSGATWTALR